MQAGLVIEAILRGDRVVWSAVAVLWVVATVLVVGGPRERAGTLRVGVVLAVACGTSVAGAVLSRALSIPRMVWKEATEAELVAAGGDTWRRLQGPAVHVQVGGAPEIAVPTVDSAGRWVLIGLFSGQPLRGLPPAPVATPEIGAPRLCPVDGERCRAWPATWPDPQRALPLRELQWSREGVLSALAYDAESGLFLRETNDLATGGGVLQLLGRLSSEAPREGSAALFIAHRIAGHRLQAVRVVAITSGASHAYRLHRADASLSSGRGSLRFLAGPMVLCAILSLFASLLAFLLAPAWLGARLRRQSAVRRELSRALVLIPVAGGARRAGLLTQATVSDDADWGGALLPRGTLVSVAVASHDQPVASRGWFELPEAQGGAEAGEGAEAARLDGPVSPEPQRVGMLVPADEEPFRKAARAWVQPYVYSLAILATGLAAMAPAVVAVAVMLGGR